MKDFTVKIVGLVCQNHLPDFQLGSQICQKLISGQDTYLNACSQQITRKLAFFVPVLNFSFIPKCRRFKTLISVGQGRIIQ